MTDSASKAGPGAQVAHRTLKLDGMEIFYREAGPPGAPVLLLPHGYPCSSFEFRNLMPALGDRWRVVAPDFPGSGLSGTPADFDYSFGGYAQFLRRFAAHLGIEAYVLYLHDFGTWIGLRLAMQAPERVRGLIIQNGDIYEDALGPKYEGLTSYFRSPTEAARGEIEAAVSEEGFREEFLNDVGPALSALIPPELWKLHWALTTAQRRDIYIGLILGLQENFGWFPRYQAYLRQHQPPALICWGPNDGYMPEKSARAYLRDLPQAELHLLGGGHWLLETHLSEVVPRVRGFLERVAAPLQGAPTS